MKETKQLEFKEKITNTFLKTVSAFANYDGGRIMFGVRDDGMEIGLENPEQSCLDIENKINDSIRPQPDYELTVQTPDKIVLLDVKPGRHKPYMYKSKAYRRNDTATIEVDSLELSRLILEGKNLHFEQLSADNQDLTFKTFEKLAVERIGIEKMSRDVLKTFNLYSDQYGFNHAAELLSDQNTFPGIDVARFGDSISIILKRSTLESCSVLEELGQAMDIYRDYYQYEEIRGEERKQISRIPESAYREAVANALIYRVWDTEARIRILMFEDRIEITSPGGLPSGISKEEYLHGNVSVLRNPILGNVFYRLHLVEILGTGIRRIMETYHGSDRKPSFEIYDNSIVVILPAMDATDMTEDEKAVYQVLSKNIPKAVSEITKEVPFGKSKTGAILKELVNRNYVTVQGNGRGTKYLK